MPIFLYLELIDFSFVLEELVTKYCLDNGRKAVEPVCLFKYLLLKTIYDLSDVDVVERSYVDMSFKYFLDMAPEEDVINPGTLTKFRRLRLKDMDLLKTLVEHIKENEKLTSIPKIKEKLNLLRETLDDIADHYTLSKDADARTGHKTKDSSFFGFKTHIAMTEERIITAATITSGEKGDGPQLPALVAISKENGMPVTWRSVRRKNQDKKTNKKKAVIKR